MTCDCYPSWYEEEFERRREDLHPSCWLTPKQEQKWQLAYWHNIDCSLKKTLTAEEIEWEKRDIASKEHMAKIWSKELHDNLIFESPFRFINRQGV